LGKVRGKVVIISNVAGLSGIQWNDMVIQDEYDEKTSYKVELVKNYMHKCISDNSLAGKKYYILIIPVSHQDL
jgi:hypothetical protein